MNATEAQRSIRNGLNSEKIPFTLEENKFIVDNKYYDSVKALFMFFIEKEGEDLQLKVDNEIVSIVFS